MGSSCWQRCGDRRGKNGRIQCPYEAIQEVGSVFRPLGDHSGDYSESLVTVSDSQGYTEKAAPLSSSSALAIQWCDPGA